MPRTPLSFNSPVRQHVLAFVVYDASSPNTEAVARAIADGIGADARAVSATEASLDELRRADLLVVGASVRPDLPTPAPAAAGVQHKGQRPHALLTAALRRVLDGLPPTHATGMAFETRLWWSAHTVKFTIGAAMSAAGCRVVRHETFVVRHRGGRLAAGELDRARLCGTDLAASLRFRGSPGSDERDSSGSGEDLVGPGIPELEIPTPAPFHPLLEFYGHERQR